ncbi:MAG: alanine racemase [Bacteroidales bacterium]
MASTSYIHIGSESLANNVQFLKELVGVKTRISAVIKGNAYGHGVSVVIPTLEKAGIDHFSVYSSHEARDAHQYLSPRSTLMIMGYVHPTDMDWILNNEVEFYVSGPFMLEDTINRARKLNKRAIIHLELETGMYRTGFTVADLKKAVPLLCSTDDHLILRGITSHFAGAESIANYTRVRKQFTLFNRLVRSLEQEGITAEIKHIASSAAAINYPETRLDLVRCGILIYGYWPTRETFMNYAQREKKRHDPLKRALSWHSRVMHVKEVPEGEFIGYGLSYQSQSPMKIAVVPVGYCNGYSRSLSNNGHVIIREMRASVIGLVNMNMIICDISEIPDVKPGDEVTLIGRQGASVISFSSFAEMNNSLNYEILARLPENINRQLTQF